jgi:myo-inositol-1(or 4)-monophosphatase
MDLILAMQVASQAARAAGAIIMGGLDRTLAVDDKGSSNNLVTQIDRDCEALIVGLLGAAFPETDFMGEEAQYPERGRRWLWVIDPLDGTTNFIKGIRWFSVSIGLWDRQLSRPVLGVVYSPAHGELFRAVDGGGAWVDEADGRTLRLTVGRRLEWDSCLLTTGFYYDRGDSMSRTLAQAEAFMRAGVMDIRRLGSAALDLANVAAGRLDGFWEHVLSPWDYMAGLVLVREAGGLTSDYAGAPLGLGKSSMVAANPALHGRMVEFLAGT